LSRIYNKKQDDNNDNMIKELYKSINDLNDQLKNEKNNNRILNEQIELLTKQLNEKNSQNNNLIQENQKLINDLKIDPQKKNEINLNNNEDKEIIKLNQKIKELYKTIEELKQKLLRYPYDLSEGEQLISVIITSLDQKIHQSIICKNTDKFSELEEKLYKNFPKYEVSEIYCYANGKKIKRIKKLSQNNICDNDIIILTKREI
jgi:chromosome segregation ATPase